MLLKDKGRSGNICKHHPHSERLHQYIAHKLGILKHRYIIPKCSKHTAMLLLLFLGIILPSSTTLALDLERKNSGNASALLGFLMFLFGGVLSPLTGLGNMLYTTGIIIVACCIGTWFCNHIATSHITLKVTKQ